MANQYEMNGTIKVINDTQTFSSGFQKREFVITTEDKYPQDIKFEFVKDKISQLDSFKTGDEVKVAFDVRGNEYQGRYYVNLSAWKIENASGGTGAPADDRPAHLDEAAAAGFVENEDEPF